MGIGNLMRHTKKCPRISTRDIAQTLIEQSEKGVGVRSRKFSQEKFWELLIVAIIKHELPFQFVEYEGIQAAFTYLEPQVCHFTRNMARVDVMKLYKMEKNKFVQGLRSCKGKVCFTSDSWTSIATDGYICLTAHYVDNDWTLQKRIISFSYMSPPHSGIALCEKIGSLLVEWGLDRKVLTMTLDNASANDTFVDYFKDQLLMKCQMLSGGDYLHVRYCAHILNLIVQESLKEIDACVEKVHECVKYVKGSQVRKERFLASVKHCALDSRKELRQDVPTRWNSTYLMLHSSLHYRRAFNYLKLVDSNFFHCPSVVEWEKVEKFCKFLEVFYDTTNLFSGTKYPTTNLYFPKVFQVEMTLQHHLTYDDVAR